MVCLDSYTDTRPLSSEMRNLSAVRLATGLPPESVTEKYTATCPGFITAALYSVSFKQPEPIHNSAAAVRLLSRRLVLEVIASPRKRLCAL